MKMTGFRYHRPETVDEALGLLSEHGDDAKVLAGGQSLLPLMAMRLASPGHVVDIGRLPLDLLEVRDGSLTVGAGVRHSTAERADPVARAAPLVHAALPHVGHRAVRNRGTVCGSLAHSDPAAELPAVAIALDATFSIRSNGASRTVAASDFFTGYLTTDLSAGELLTEVAFPVPPLRSGAAVYEVSRRHGDFALVGAAVQVTLTDADRVDAAAIALFGVASTPVRSAAAEAALVGRDPTTQVLDDAAEAVRSGVDPVSDVHATAAYRRHVAGVVARRALAEAVDRAREGGA